MSRSIISIGCNTYDHIGGLSAAESDAQRIYGLLTGTGRYHYRADTSSLLLSPTTGQVREVLQTLYEAKPTELCLYFAGHAESREGRLYLKFRDTRNQVLPPTSITLGEIIDQIVQAPNLTQLNVVVDACNAGGLAEDLSRVLSEQAQRLTGNVSISILAGSGPANPAMETSIGGRLTSAVCDLLTGALVAQKWSPYLELSQVSEAVQRVPAVAAQHPSHWSMNLRGANYFGPNPSFDPGTAAIAAPANYFQGDVPLSGDQQESMRVLLHQIRTAGFDPSMLRPVQDSLSALPENQQVSVYLGLANSVEFYERDRITSPPQRELMLIQALLPLTGSQSGKAVLAVQSRALIRRVLERLDALHESMASDNRFLLPRPAGFGLLYTFPMQLSLLLGWIGFAAQNTAETTTRDRLLTLTRLVLEQYGNSLVSIDDRQAPGLLTFFMGARLAGWTTEVEEVLGRLFYDLLSTHGRIARNGSSSKDRIRYLLKRYHPHDDLRSITQRPSELMAVVLAGGAIVGLDNYWDPWLHELDHCSMNFFVANDPQQFGEDRIADGDNITMRIGDDFHRLSEVRGALRDLGPSSSMSAWEDQVALDAISLAMPDRCNWPHLLGRLASGTIPTWIPPLIISVEDPLTGLQDVIYDQHVSA